MGSLYSFEFEGVLICWRVFLICCSGLALSNIFLVNKPHEKSNCKYSVD